MNLWLTTAKLYALSDWEHPRILKSCSTYNITTKTMHMPKNYTIMETLASENVIENKFSGTSRVDSRIRH